MAPHQTGPGSISSSPLRSSTPEYGAYDTSPNINMAPDARGSSVEPIAICGMALRLPGGIMSPSQFWDFLLAKKDARSRVPESRYNIDSYYSKSGKPGSVKSQHGYFLDEDVDLGSLDTSFFIMPKVELERADPQQRQLLEVARECLESAGEVNFRGKDIGCWVGSFGEDWCESFAKDQQHYGMYRISGSGDFVLSNRISYEFDFRGPSMTVRTGCSSALIGLHEACLAIGRGECSAAIIGGCNLIMAPGMTVAMTEQGVLSPEGSCKTFDAAADGYARGEAINAVYIKRLNDALRDGNPIRAVIRASSSNCDGKTAGMTLPSSESHEAMIRRTYAAAGITRFNETAFVECHGTGTQTGDPIEVCAVANVFGEEGVYIGSVKPNVGHSEGASGISSLIKAVLALEHRVIPPNIKFNNPNLKIPWEEKKLRVPTEPTPWPQHRAERVGVNSFGIGGANAHVVIDSARSFLHDTQDEQADGNHLMPQARLMLYSANTAESLRRNVVNLQQYADRKPDCASDLAYTLATRREHLPHRAFAVIGPEISANTSPFAKVPSARPEVVMIFTGQGAQWPQMGLELLENNTIFRDSIKAMDNTLQSLSNAPDWTIREELAKSSHASNIGSAAYSQPLCTAVQMALVDVYSAIGVRPYAVVGHSSGEIAAAYAAGRLTAYEAIIAAYHRGLVSGLVTKTGAMAAIGMSRDQTEGYLEEGVVVACENSPSSVTISGDAQTLHKVLAKIQTDKPDVAARALKVDKAYHSHHMKDIGPEYHRLSKHHVKGKVANPGSPLFVSSVTGKRLLEKQILTASYWQLNLESPVLFRTAVETLLKHQAELGDGQSLLFLEVGPHSALQGPLRQILAQESTNAPYFTSLVRGKNAEESFLSAVGHLHLQGVRVDLNALTNPNGNAKVLVDLPNYAWEHSASYLYQSRLSKEWRLRQFAKHELLGIRVAESTDNEPIWRNMLHLDHVPWIRDHNIKGDVIYPCAGYVGMVGEAVRQLSVSASKNDGYFGGYSLREVVVSTAMVLSETKPAEVITSLKRYRLTESLDSAWWDFTVSSHNGSGWMKHCSGQVMARMGTGPRSEVAFKPLHRPVETERWYTTMRRMGANYGPYFQGLTNITSATTFHSACAETIDTCSDDDEAYYCTHPTQIDFLLQLFSVSHAKGINRNANSKMVVPTNIEEVDVFTSDNTLQMQIETFSNLQGSVCGGGQALTKTGSIALRMKGVKLTPLEGDGANEAEDPHAAARLEWRPDIDFINTASLIKSVVDRRSYHAKLHRLTELCSAEALRRLSDVTSRLPHLNKFHKWMQSQVSAELSARPDLMSELQLLVDQLSLTPAVSIATAMMKVLNNVVDIFAVKVEPIEVLMADQLLTKLYTFVDEGNREMFIQTLAHNKPNLRVLEIGAGTGGTTNSILENLRHPQSEQYLYSKYSFTDISAGFFPAAKERFKQYPNIDYSVLDISKDPLVQNFEPYSYDLIIASNVLHATPSLHQTLKNVHKLLHPEGRLLLQELCSEQKSLNFIMGVLPGWWLGDEDNRSEEPYVAPERWQSELKRAGFRGLDAVIFDAPDSMHLNAFMVAQPERLAREDQSRKVAILYDDHSQSLAKQFNTLLEEKKYQATPFRLGSAIPRSHDIISLIDVRKPFFEQISEETFKSFQNFVDVADSNAIFWVTGSSQMGCRDPRYAQTIGTSRAIRSELSRDLATCEVDDVDSHIIQVVDVFEKFVYSRHDQTRKPDYEYAVSKSMVYTSRFYPYILRKELETPIEASDDQAALNLTIGRYGRLSTLRWTPCPNIALLSGEVVVEVEAVGMNFKDVLIAMGIVGSTSANFGLEGAGTIKAVGSGVSDMKAGDRVLVFGAGCFSTSLVVSASLCAKIPDNLSFEDAATMPCVFATAIYSLLHVGRLEKGMTVLIHSACGGVGIAAIQICLMMGAEIFCTVGNEEKVNYLMSTFGIPRNRIFNSHDTSFLSGVTRETQGRGVDLVLNSLSGELLHASWKCVAEFGTMLEIGKRDLIGKGKLAMDVFEANRNYCGIDLGLVTTKPALGKRLLQDIVRLYSERKIQPIRPVKRFTFSTVEECFRYMQKGTHIGKLIVSRSDADAMLPNSVPLPHVASFDPKVSYLLVGGLGGLGKAVSTWMVEHGARHLVYLSRSAGQSSEDRAFFEELKSQGCHPRVVRGSVLQQADVELALKAEGIPVKGILQMSMVLRDQAFLKMKYEDWTTAVQPKVQGTWNLHHAALKLGIKLDFFVMFSSLSGIVGHIGQSNYAAGNTFLDSFVQYRQNNHLRASVINIGLMEDSGYLARNPAMLKRLHATGLYSLREPELLDALSQAIKVSQKPETDRDIFKNDAQTIIGLRSTIPLSSPQSQINWRTDRRMAFYSVESETKSGNTANTGDNDKLSDFLDTVATNPSILESKASADFLARQIAVRLFSFLLKPVDDETEIAITASLADIGLDSLVAIEMRAWWKQSFGFDISVLEMLGMGSVAALGKHAADGLKSKLNEEETKARQGNADDGKQMEGYLAMKAP